jgi:hypothetical protein
MGDSENEWESDRDDESDYNEDARSLISDQSDQELDDTEEKNQLLDQKYKCIVFFNEGSLDIDEFNRQIKKINDSLKDLQFVNDYYNNDLLNKELVFTNLLDNYIFEIRRNKQNFLNLNHLYTIYNEIKNLRNKKMKEVDNEPLDSRSLDENLEELFKKEQKYLNKVAKEIYAKGLTPELLKEPSINFFPDLKDYYHAYDQYIRKISKYINTINYAERMNVTSIGSSFDKYQKKLKEKLIELKEFRLELPIKVSEQDTDFFDRRSILKNIMMKMDIKQLIECAISVETHHIFEQTPEKEKFEFKPSVIEKIRKYYSLQKHNLQGVITNTLRKQSVKRLKNIFNSDYMDNLEIEIHKLSENNINVYSNKINDILFILQNYPNFKKLIPSLSVQQFALFEKEIAFETIIQTAPTNITKRRSTIRLLKSALLKNTLFTGILNNYKSNVFSKKLELLIYDISKNNRTYNYYSEKLFNYIKQNPNNAFKDSKEKILLFLQLKFKKQKITFDFSKLNETSVRALLSQEKILLDSLIEKKQKNLVKIKNKKIKYLEKRLIQLMNIEQDHSKTILTKPIPNTSVISFNTNAKLLNEAVQVLKRKLMVDSLPILHEQKNKLIHFLEILDINDLLNKNVRLQNKIVPLIMPLLPSGYFIDDFNNHYYNVSNQIINNFVNNFKVTYTEDIPDYYNHFILDKLFRSKSPVDFYSKEIQRKYYRLLEESTTKPVPEYRRLKILYNPYTGQFGDPTGYLFEVEKLQSQANGQPVMEEEPITQIDPRTGQIKYSTHKVTIPGRDSFIKVPILTNKKDVFNYQWIKLPAGKVAHMYTTNYDSCDRFTNSQDCNSGKGMSNSKCVYSNRKCKSEYNLTKIETQNLKETKNRTKLEGYAKEAKFELLSFGSRKIKKKVF